MDIAISTSSAGGSSLPHRTGPALVSAAVALKRCEADKAIARDQCMFVEG